MKTTKPTVCQDNVPVGRGKYGPCDKPVTHRVVDYFYVAAKGHKDLYVCAEHGEKHAGFPNHMTVKPLRKVKP